MTEKPPLTFDEAVAKFSKQAAHVVYSRFRDYVEFEDCQAEALIWAYGEGKSKVQRWVANDPQQTSRIRYSMIEAATSYARKEKGLKTGFPEDQFRYSRSIVEEHLVDAQNDNWTGQSSPDADVGQPKAKPNPAQTGNVLAVVIDIRRAAKVVGWDVGAIVQYLNNTQRYIGVKAPRVLTDDE